jgi:hypothetical protein
MRRAQRNEEEEKEKGQAALRASSKLCRPLGGSVMCGSQLRVGGSGQSIRSERRADEKSSTERDERGPVLVIRQRLAALERGLQGK